MQFRQFFVSLFLLSVLLLPYKTRSLPIKHPYENKSMQYAFIELDSQECQNASDLLLYSIPITIT